MAKAKTMFTLRRANGKKEIVFKSAIWLPQDQL